MTWTTNEQPFGVNHAPLLSGLASDGSGKEVPVAVDKDTGELLVSGGGGGGGGTSSTFGAVFPTTGTAAGATDGTNMQPLKVDGSDNLLVKVNAALPAGTNVIGHVITDTGSTTAVTGTVTVNAGSATGAAVPANAFYMGLNDGTNLVGMKDSAAIGDANAGTGVAAVGLMAYNGTTWDRLHEFFVSGDANSVQTGLYTLPQPLIYNGTNYDRQRSATAASNTTGTGLLGAAELAVAATALPAAASATNYTTVMSDKFGRQVVLPNAMRDLVLPITQLTLTATTTETTLIGQVASTFLDIVSLVVINTSATATQVDFRDSTAGTIRLSLYVPAGDTRGIALPTPLPQNAVNNNWTAKCGTSVSSVIITGTYITNK